MTAAGRTLAPFIDHTLLKPDATAAQVVQLCREARRYGFAAVCVTPIRVALALRELADCPVKVGTVIGFPLGASGLDNKAAEAQRAARQGVHELDMVMDIGALKDGDPDAVLRELKAVVTAAPGKTVKVIIETALLTDEEKKIACGQVVNSGAHFVKTSTGFFGGATVADVRLLRETVGPRFGVKASGGIRTAKDAAAMVEAGATRIGTSSGVAIVTG